MLKIRLILVAMLLVSGTACREQAPESGGRSVETVNSGDSEQVDPPANIAGTANEIIDDPEGFRILCQLVSREDISEGIQTLHLCLFLAKREDQEMLSWTAPDNQEQIHIEVVGSLNNSLLVLAQASSEIELEESISKIRITYQYFDHTTGNEKKEITSLEIVGQ